MRDESGKREGVVAALFFVSALLLRLPFRSQLAYHWDSAQFALAISDYNVRLSQPHAPGYFLYVMLSKLVNLWLQDPHASLVWVSVVFGSALAALMYLLGTAIGGWRTGILSGLLATTSPQLWFHSCVALTYIVDSLLVCLTVFWCWRAMRTGGSWLDTVAIGILIAAVGGVRQQTVPALAPLVLYAFWKFRKPRFVKLIVATVVAVSLGLAWFVPMTRLSGGLPLYLDEVRLHVLSNARLTLWGGGWDAVTWNVFFVGLYCANGLMLGTVVLIWALLYRTFKLKALQKRAWDQEHSRCLMVLALWIGPMVVVGIIGFTRQPGYVLSYLPALLLLLALVVAQLKKTWIFVATSAVLCAVNAGAFLAWPRSWDGAFFGLGRTARAIRQHDELLTSLCRRIRSEFQPSNTLVCHADEDMYFGLRFFQLYLPEFEQCQLMPDPTIAAPEDKPLLGVKGGKLIHVSTVEALAKPVWLLVVPPSRTVDIFAPYLDVAGAEPVAATDGMLYELRRKGRADGG
jgi:hypothetical protein